MARKTKRYNKKQIKKDEKMRKTKNTHRVENLTIIKKNLGSLQKNTEK